MLLRHETFGAQVCLRPEAFGEGLLGVFQRAAVLDVGCDAGGTEGKVWLPRFVLTSASRAVSTGGCYSVRSVVTHHAMHYEDST